MKGIGHGLAKQIEQRFFASDSASRLVPVQDCPTSSSSTSSAAGPSTDPPNKHKQYAPRQNSPAWLLLLALRLARAQTPSHAAPRQALLAHLRQALLAPPCCQVNTHTQSHTRYIYVTCIHTS